MRCVNLQGTISESGILTGMTNIKNKKTAWIEFTIQAAFLREILHSLNHPPSDLKLFTKGLPQISKQ